MLVTPWIRRPRGFFGHNPEGCLEKAISLCFCLVSVKSEFSTQDPAFCWDVLRNGIEEPCLAMGESPGVALKRGEMDWKDMLSSPGSEDPGFSHRWSVSLWELFIYWPNLECLFSVLAIFLWDLHQRLFRVIVSIFALWQPPTLLLEWESCHKQYRNELVSAVCQ